jgi:hypothetical protein
MNKAMIIGKLLEVTDFQLLGDGTWPASREVVGSFEKILRDLGLEEDLPGSPGSSRSTALGLELNVRLMMAFAGVYDVWDIPSILQENSYLDDEEVVAVWEAASEDEGERLVHRYVLRAYLEFCNRSRFLN